MSVSSILRSVVYFSVIPDYYACQRNVEIVPDQLCFFFGSSSRILRVCIKRLGNKDVFLFIPFLRSYHPHSDYSVHCKQVLAHFMTDNFMVMKLLGYTYVKLGLIILIPNKRVLSSRERNISSGSSCLLTFCIKVNCFDIIHQVMFEHSASILRFNRFKKQRNRNSSTMDF